MGKLTAVQRQQLFADRKDGMSIKSLVNKYGICRKSVQRWVSEGFKSHPNWEDGARSGRPRSLSNAQRKKARASAQRGHTAPHIAASISQQAQHGVSPATVRRALTGSKCPMYWAPKNRGRVLSEANKAKRLAFCLKVKPRRLKAGRFADSKLFFLYKDGTGSDTYEWHSPGAKPKQVPTGNPFVVHVYACIGKGFKSPLYFTAPTPSTRSGLRKAKATFTSRDFIVVAGQMQHTFHQHGTNTRYNPVVLDHAKQHTAKKSKAAMEAMGMQLLQDFPPQSWDLNIIENCWGVMEQKLAGIAGRSPTTIKGWRARIKRAWASISQSTINRLVASLDQRVADIKVLKGAWLRAKAG